MLESDYQYLERQDRDWLRAQREMLFGTGSQIKPIQIEAGQPCEHAANDKPKLVATAFGSLDVWGRYRCPTCGHEWWALT